MKAQSHRGTQAQSKNSPLPRWEGIKGRGMLLLAALILITGCAGNTPEPGDILGAGMQVGLYMVLKNNPDYAQPTLEILQGIKATAQGDVTYNDLLLYTQKQFAGDEDLAAIALIVGSELFTDEPIINSIGIFDGYREDLISRIDGLLLVASIFADATD